jgi:hypothetical protein
MHHERQRTRQACAGYEVCKLRAFFLFAKRQTTMIRIRTKAAERRSNTFIYGQGTNYCYCQFQVTDGEDVHAFRIRLPKILPEKYLRAARDAAIGEIEKHQNRWGIEDVKDLQRRAQAGLNLIAAQEKAGE